MRIHPTAVIEDGALLHDSVRVGAYAYIGAMVRIGADTVVHHHASIEGNTELGKENEVYPYAFLGGRTQDKKYTGGDLGLVIGDNNTFREYCSVHESTIDGTRTIIGDHNLFLGYSHVAHDCVVANNLIMSGASALGGHVHVDDSVYIAWSAGISPFCRIGKYAIAGAMAKVTQDIPPFMMADGAPAKVAFINKVRLEREGCSSEEIQLAKEIYKVIYKKGLNRSQAIETLTQHPNSESWLIQSMIEFSGKSERGFA